jgi:hypothetical protein
MVASIAFGVSKLISNSDEKKICDYNTQATVKKPFCTYDQFRWKLSEGAVTFTQSVLTILSVMLL